MGPFLRPTSLPTVQKVQHNRPLQGPFTEKCSLTLFDKISVVAAAVPERSISATRIESHALIRGQSRQTLGYLLGYEEVVEHAAECDALPPDQNLTE
ncbi:hypothetical protein LIER_23562 [Lithospermum erythrorhizon]|uniref:Uncharacterized protein n=1 Tax=Lithospermum erythrorhizon TaxID=34254 RepID=A0AAV3QY82_LITER